MRYAVLFLFLLCADAMAIIEGVDVQETDALSKSVVALQMVEKTQSGDLNYYKGSGVIISDRVILSAGHSFFYLDDVSQSEAIFSVSPAWGPKHQGQKRIGIQEVHIYPGFSQGPSGTINDLALVVLNEPVPVGYQPLPMQLSAATADRLLVLGYGADSSSDFRLRELEMSSDKVDSQKIWLTREGGGISGGDSGGPALLFENGSYLIYGIAIHRAQEGQSAFSYLPFFAKWIQDTLCAISALECLPTITTFSTLSSPIRSG